MRKWIVYIVCLMCSLEIAAQSVEDIITDIYEQVAEQGGDLENLKQDFMDLYTHKINVNTANFEDLQRLRFLSDWQIDNILLYVEKHPMESTCELQLVPGLRDYEVRNLSYFLVAEKVDEQERIYAKEVFHFAKHEISLRADARNIEHYEGDPYYGNLRYRFNYKNTIKAGVTLQRGAGENWKDLHYGGFVELNKISKHLKTLTVGNFQGKFGQGLVLGEDAHVGKSSYIMSSGNGPEGVHKYSSVSDSYDYLHGAGMTLALGPVDVSVLYSIQKEEAGWHHVVGLNSTYRRRHLQVGLTAMEDIYTKDSTYTVFGANARYKRGIWDVYGEAAASYKMSKNEVINTDERWGFGTIVGTKITPLEGLGLHCFYRYYSQTFANRYAHAFAETSKVNDERGLYIGSEVKMVPNWRFSLYADGFAFMGTKYGIPRPSTGWDVMTQADYEHSEAINMFWKVRARRKYITDTYSLCYRFNWDQGGWHLRTQADGTLVNKDGRGLTWGVSVLQDIHYSFSRVPITLQLRLQGFDIRQWDNRVYIYENDVLYAYSIPATYGRGGRCYLNFRYKICKQVSMYLRVSETVYHPDWEGQQKNRTDVHLMVRSTL